MSIFTDMIPAELLINEYKKDNLEQSMITMYLLVVSWWLFTKITVSKTREQSSIRTAHTAVSRCLRYSLMVKNIGLT